MKLLIGIDGGGTKTDAVLTDESGHILSRVKGGGSNLTSISEDEVFNNLKDLLTGLTAGFGGLNTEFDACFAGVGGCGFGLNKKIMNGLITRILPQARCIGNGSDSINAMNSGIGLQDGIVAIAGTGSCVFVRVSNKMIQIGGWGYLLGDEGSGYHLGQMALNAVLRAHDGRGEKTVLTEMCREKLGSPVHEMISEIYQGGRMLIASFAPVLINAGAAGDAVAGRLLEQAIQMLCETIAAAAVHLPLPVQVVLAGGLWQEGGLIIKRTGEILGPQFKLIIPHLPPVYGSVIEAGRMAGIKIGADFEKVFSQMIEKV